jgi:hypothetical protein
MFSFFINYNFMREIGIIFTEKWKILPSTFFSVTDLGDKFIVENKTVTNIYIIKNLFSYLCAIKKFTLISKRLKL